MRSRLFGVVICLVGCWLFAGTAAQSQICNGIAPSNNTTLERITIADLPAGQRPLLVTAPPGDPTRIFIVGQDGVIWVKNFGSNIGTQSVYMDIDARVNSGSDERGLLGFAFDPDFASNGLFYVNYTNAAGDTIVSRFSDAGGVGDPNSEKALLFIDQPEANHNGGEIMFGPDNLLYVFTGDGGGGGDGHGACGNGQNINTLLGKILRIDVHHAGATEADCGGIQLPYGVVDNPYVGEAGCDEIYSIGMRNPWRNDFDSLTGDLYSADVGQGCWEEINYAAAGDAYDANFGWRQTEGDRCYNPSQGCNATAAANCTPACNDPGLTDPVLDYASNGGNCSVTGGVVYRGCRMANFQGQYFYGDYCAGSVLSFEVTGGVASAPTNWTGSLGGNGLGFADLTSFGKDARGELYITDRDGEVYAVEPEFADVQVGSFQLDPGDWNWQDLDNSTWRSVSGYTVYRSDTTPDDDYCTLMVVVNNDWTGDPDDPSPGELFSYFVTATSGADESNTGGSPRNISGVPCI